MKVIYRTETEHDSTHERYADAVKEILLVCAVTLAAMVLTGLAYMPLDLGQLIAR